MPHSSLSWPSSPPAKPPASSSRVACRRGGSSCHDASLLGLTAPEPRSCRPPCSDLVPRSCAFPQSAASFSSCAMRFPASFGAVLLSLGLPRLLPTWTGPVFFILLPLVRLIGHSVAAFLRFCFCVRSRFIARFALGRSGGFLWFRPESLVTGPFFALRCFGQSAALALCVCRVLSL